MTIISIVYNTIAFYLFPVLVLLEQTNES